jgi:hypothetical protein
MRWPATVPTDVQTLANELMAVLEGHSGDVMGPALCMTFAYTMLELGGQADDPSALDRMMADLTRLVVAHGAATERQTH